MRKLLRLLFVTLAGTLILTIISGVVGEFFIELAREKDWYTNPSQRLDAVMDALVASVTQSWFLITTALIVGLSGGMWIDAILRPHEVQRPTAVKQPDAPTRTSGGSDDVISPEYVKLSNFFNEYLLPLSDALIALRAAILASGIDNEVARSMAAHGLNQPTFFGSLRIVTDKLGYSPVEYPSYYELSVSIHNAEFSYQDCLDDTNRMSSAFDLLPSTDSRLQPAWESWRVRHNALVDAYKDIKLDPMLRGLYRPRRESKWGPVVPSAQSVDPHRMTTDRL